MAKFGALAPSMGAFWSGAPGGRKPPDFFTLFQMGSLGKPCGPLMLAEMNDDSGRSARLMAAVSDCRETRRTRIVLGQS